MRTILGGVAAVAALFATPVAAWIPASTTFALSGTVNGCAFTGTLVTTSSGPAIITAASTSGSPCTTLFLNTPYEVIALSPTSIRIRYLRILSIGRECRGDVIGTWNNMTGQISLNTALPAVISGQPPCPVIGTISTTPQLLM